MRLRLAGAVGLAVVLVGAGTACVGPPEIEPLPEVAPRCNPLMADHCLLPWPSSAFLAPDPQTVTGLRVAYPEAALPATADGVHLDPTRFNLLDGFSPASQILVYFDEGIGPEGLPGVDDLERSMTADSLIWVFDFVTGERVPLFAELDANAQGDEMAALIIRPQVPLRFDRRYVVVLRRGLQDACGEPLEPPAGWQRVRDGIPSGRPRLEAWRPGLAEVVDAIEAQGLARDEVILAWDFHTASESAVVGNLQHMVDTALEQLGPAGPTLAEVSQTDLSEEESAHILRQIAGRMVVPSFLESDVPDAWLKLDASGRPTLRGTEEVDFWVNIPRCAESAEQPLPVLIAGHGLFSDAEEMLDSAVHQELGQRLCMVEATVRWRGLSSVDLVPVAQSVPLDLSSLPRITDRLQQAQVDMHALVHLLRGALRDEPAMRVGGRPVTDGTPTYFLGISNGAIQGVAFAALSPDIERFVLHVGGGVWSLLIQRSANFHLFSIMLRKVYGSALDTLIALGLTQHLWDYTDPASFARRLLSDPLPGRAPKRVVLQESRYDESVTNLATRELARAIGLPALSPMVEPVFGLRPEPGPLSSAYVQWDVKPSVKPPGTNTSPVNPPADESPHDTARLHESWKRQVEAFLQPGGQVIHTCAGPCDPN